jgi:hypothetical protein
MMMQWVRIVPEAAGRGERVVPSVVRPSGLRVPEGVGIVQKGARTREGLSRAVVARWMRLRCQE